MMDWAITIHQVLLLLKPFARDAIPAFVRALVEVPGVGDLLHQGSNPEPVSLFRRSDEIVVRNIKTAPDATKRLLHLVAKH